MNNPEDNFDLIDEEPIKEYKTDKYEEKNDSYYNDQYNFASLYDELIDLKDIRISKEILEDEVLKFDEMGDSNLKENLLRGIYAYGYTTPSRIQSYAIPQMIKGHNILAQSQSGTGKTGAFVISALQLINEHENRPQVIILSPTHELAQQTFLVAMELSEFMKIKISMTIGKVDRRQNLNELCNSPENAQLVIATPGRLKDLMNYSLDKRLHIFEGVKLLIVDECDELLSNNFKSDLHDIIRLLYDYTKIALFSATLTSEIVELSGKIMEDSKKILIKKENMTLDGITQTFVECNNDDQKLAVLMDILSTTPIDRIIIYANTKEKVNYLNSKLNENNYSTISINGENTSIDRITILRDFKRGKYKCLVATDLLSRGIDIQQLSLMINFELPRDNLSSYIHRIGRCGRFGRMGLSINLINTSSNKNNRYKNNNHNNRRIFDEKAIQTRIITTFKCEICPLEVKHLNYIE